MGFFKKIKKTLFSSSMYEINKNILTKYINNSIQYAQEENSSFCDEFFIAINENEQRKHITIINYDAPCDCPLEEEKGLKGIILFVNDGGFYKPQSDKKYYNVEDFINFELNNYPEKFILIHEQVSPTELKQYKI